MKRHQRRGGGGISVTSTGSKHLACALPGGSSMAVGA